MNKEAAISAMLTGLIFTSSYIVYFKFINPSANTSANWWFGISPEGIGTLGMIFSFLVALLVSRVTPSPPAEIQNLVDDIRVPVSALKKANEI
jgi:cation/acetate symporter